MFRPAAVIAVALLTVIAPMLAETQDVPRFESQVNAVHLTVSVFNEESRRYVSDLDRDAFTVSEDGVPQRITFFFRDELPIRAVLLLDMSGSVEPRIGEIQDAARMFFKGLGPQDMVQVAMFHHSMSIVQDFTSDRALLESAIDDIPDGDETSLYDSIYISLRELHDSESPGEMKYRKAIVVLTDGIDTSSLASAEDVLHEARVADVTAYPVVLSPPAALSQTGNLLHSKLNAEQLEVRWFLGQLAEITGGRLFEPDAQRPLGSTYENIARELSVQYGIAYQTYRQLDDSYRRITVRVPDRGTLLLRHRSGYLAVPDHR